MNLGKLMIRSIYLLFFSIFRLSDESVINDVAVFYMIKDLQNEIKVSNKNYISNYNHLHTQDFNIEIDKENIKMEKSRELDPADKFDGAHIYRLMILQKEDVKMKRQISK